MDAINTDSHHNFGHLDIPDIQNLTDKWKLSQKSIKNDVESRVSRMTYGYAINKKVE